MATPLPFPRPASLDPSFTITRATEADIERLADIYYDSFATDPRNTYWWSEDREAMREWLRARVRRKMADRQVRHFQVVLDNGGDDDDDDDGRGREVVAFVRWDIPKGHEERFGDWAGVDVDVDAGLSARAGATAGAENGPLTGYPAESAIEAPRGADPALIREFFGIVADLSKKWDAEKMLGLSLLCTAPEYHRRGAGKALLTPMLAIADAAGLRSYVEATPAGRPLYEKLGFQVVEVKELNATAVTGGKVNGRSELAIMIREPQPLVETTCVQDLPPT